MAEMLRVAGARLDVRSCACAGDLGIYEASLQDRGVLGYYLVHHTWEPGIQALLAHLTEPGTGVFIDVGANVGFTLIPLKLRFPELRVVGIEADMENFGYLLRNTQRNGISDAILHHRAAHSKAGELEFERSEKNAGDHRVRVGPAEGHRNLYGEGGRSVVRVACERLDEMIDPATLVGIVGMKVDIQGAEVHFLAGAQSVLAKASWLVIEYWPYGIIRAGCQPEDFFAGLEAHFPYGGLIDTNNPALPKLMPVSRLREQVWEILVRQAETAHCELLFSKTSDISPPA